MRRDRRAVRLKRCRMKTYRESERFRGEFGGTFEASQLAVPMPRGE
jgi:hypothetical protein